MATKGKTANVERRFGRFVTELKARYLFGEMKGNWKECTINKISPKRGGRGISRKHSGRFHHPVNDNFPQGTTNYYA